MPSCVIKKCSNHERKVNKEKGGVSFFRLPVDSTTRKKWCQLLKEQRAEPFFKGNSNHRVCSAHFKEDDYTITKSGRRILKAAAIPSILPIRDPAKPKKKKKELYDPFQEYANDSTDEESLDIKQEASDEEYSNDSEAPPLTDKVFVKSISYKNKRFKDGEKQSKRALLGSSEYQLDYVEELYEFGKFIAEQLMCLDVEDARVAQAEIRALLSKFDVNKIMHCMAEPSTSHAQSMTDNACTVTRVYPTVSVSAVTKPSTNRKETTNKTAEPRKQATKTASKVNSAGLSTKSGSKVDTAKSLNQPGSQVNVDGPWETQTKSLLKEVVINVNPASSLASGYVFVPTVTGSTLGNTDEIETQLGTFNETTIKVEPESESLHSLVNLTPSVTDLEILVIKYEPDSGDET